VEGARGRDTLVQEKPPIGGMIERGGDVVMRLLANVTQEIIEPLIKTTRAPAMCLDPASRGAS
jgi:transposase